MVYIKNSIFLVACEGWGIIYACAPATFRFIAGPQPPVVEVPSPGILLLSLVLRSVSRKFLGRLYAIYAGSWKMRANLSFDWRKCQCLFAHSAINVLWGLCVVTGGKRLVVPLSLARKLSCCVSERTFRISVSTLFLCSRKRLKNRNIKLSSVLVCHLMSISS